jgi:hypothetical protein
MLNRLKRVILRERNGFGRAYLSSAIPANALYHAKSAAKIPKYPPALINLVSVFPLSSAYKWPRKRKRNARSSVKKSMKKATVERRVQSRRMVVKMNQPARKYPKALLKSLTPAVAPLYSSIMLNPPGVRTIATEIQKPPYDERAVAPKVFPTAISL